jgi:diguanylate cyclase (GGDEF)-like protein
VRSTVLVVEDEAGIARMIQVLLEARGFVTLVTHSGDEALRRLVEQPVDMVLLDVMMPGMDGYEVCRRIKGDPRWRHLPVIMLTAKDTTRDKIHGLEVGADDYITKPFNTDELVARIRVLLRIQGMSQELVRRNRDLQALNAVALAVNRSLSLEEILQGALAGLLDGLGLVSGLVHLVDLRTGDLVLRGWRGLPAPPPERLRRVAPGPSWLWRALEQDEPFLLSDGAGPDGLVLAGGGPAQAVGAIPLRFQERRLGVLTIVGHRGGVLTVEETVLFAGIGRHVAIALENSRLYTETQRKAQEFEALYEVSRAMASSLELQDILGRIVSAVSSLLGTQAMSLMLLTPDGRNLSLAAGTSLFREAPPPSEEGEAPTHPSLAAIRDRRPVVVPDLASDRTFGPWLQPALDAGYSAFLTVPLIVQDRPLGCMNLHRTERRRTERRGFRADEIQLVATFAGQAAVSIENARLFEATRQMAMTDPLTGLANHREFYEQLGREMRRAQRYRRPLTLLMLDLDHFKSFNDQYGHLAGDQALRETAEVLRQNSRNVDFVARYGGEEFAIILPETDLTRAARQAERVRVAVEAHPYLLETGAQVRRMTVSVGVAALMPEMRATEDLVHDADTALYRAKTGGRNRMELARPSEDPALTV